MTSHALINFANGCSRKRRRPQLSSGAETNKLPITASSALPVFRLLEINFAGGIVRGGSSPGDYPLLQESASMRNFFFVYVFPRGNIFSQLSRPFTHGNEFCWLSAGERERERDYLFTFLYFFLRSWSDQLRTRRERIATAVLLSCAQLSFVERVFPEDKWIKGM